MGMICELRQVNPAYAQHLLDNPDEVIHYYDDANEGDLSQEAQGEELDLDKAWHGVHYLLTGTAWGGEAPWCYLVFGGDQVGDDEEHVIGYGPARILLLPAVTSFYQALTQVDSAWVGTRFDPAEMMRLDIYPNIWDRQANFLVG